MEGSEALRIFGVPLIGATGENAQKLLLTLIFIAIVLLTARAMRWLVWHAGRSSNARAAFWSRQVVNILMAAILILGIVSIWFDDPTRLTTAAGLITAGLAFALQRVITAVAGYFIILRGNTFNVGDRIVMGGVRGDVVALSHADDDPGNGPTAACTVRGAGHVGAGTPIYRPRRDHHERQGFRRACV